VAVRPVTDGKRATVREFGLMSLPPCGDEIFPNIALTNSLQEKFSHVNRRVPAQRLANSARDSGDSRWLAPLYLLELRELYHLAV
jgi:hypothetical protein